jgi:hypothetical protein
MAKRPQRNRRHRNKTRRIIHGRRRSDIWMSLGKLAGVIGSATVATLGQAELIGEPTRHYVTIIAISSTAVWAFLLGPENVKVILGKIGHLKKW